MLPEPFLVVRRLAEAFEALGIPYLVGGSIASSVYGDWRATQDVDFAAVVEDHDVDELVGWLQGEFYVDADIIRDAIAHHSSFNVIHLPTLVKADVFVRELDAWGVEEFGRRRRGQFSLEEMGGVYVASPEDMILQKLRWYRMTGERSDRQWGDVQGMLKVQGEALDFGYLERWAEELGLTDLLDQALIDAGLRPEPSAE